MTSSCSDHGRIGKFFLDFGVRFCVAGAIFGEVRG